MRLRPTPPPGHSQHNDIGWPGGGAGRFFTLNLDFGDQVVTGFDPAQHGAFQL